MKKGKKVKKEKQAVQHWRQQVERALVRVQACFGSQLGEADQNTLASVFVVEENALQLCEAGNVSAAISLLKEQKGAMVPVAIDILQRNTVQKP